MTSFLATKIAAAKAYNEAEITPKKIDVVEVHDCFTISELLALEDLGFCKPGESSKMIENGNILIDGDFPVNMDGGLKADGHPIGASGLAQIYEIVTQLRLEAGSRQVNNPEIGLMENIGGIGGTCGITLLGR
jgi:acetyl-CoA C-acetyltransferase